MKNTSIKEEKNRDPMYSGSCMTIKLLEQVIIIIIIIIIIIMVIFKCYFSGELIALS